ncbi:hypothetical protein CPB84DRAFT_1966249 [Gymnopilus junonius]|uniref:Uncharacterized protein n=1 Tax=Gymnopilus junonius TaxID=109634 RepID=A0A9P5NAB1_GYMJU|nr:hypothetical protein CPB84DRAFT_1966249 [Gymnopilus junonius]
MRIEDATSTMCIWEIELSYKRGEIIRPVYQHLQTMALHTRQHTYICASPYPITRSSSPSPNDWFIGPKCDEDQHVRNLPRTTAATRNNKHIFDALEQLAAPRPQNQPSKCGHAIRIFLCVGNGDPLNAGRWGSMCHSCPSNNRIRWLTNRLESSLIQDNAELQDWFAIRHEINGIKHTGLTPTRRQALQALTDLSASTPPSSPTRPARLPRRHAQPKPQAPASASTSNAPAAPISDEAKLNKELGVLLTFWTKNNIDPISTTIFPRFDSRVRLTDFKVELGALNIEQSAPIEIFHFGYSEWKAARWDTPHLVDPRSRVLLAHFEGVTNLVNFDDTLTWAFPNVPTFQNDKKGKRRAF